MANKVESTFADTSSCRRAGLAFWADLLPSFLTRLFGFRLLFGREPLSSRRIGKLCGTLGMDATQRIGGFAADWARLAVRLYDKRHRLLHGGDSGAMLIDFFSGALVPTLRL